MENQNTPLWDASLDINERLDWLLEALNLDEKCRMFSTLTPEVTRLGIRSTYLGEEAAHGVEAKHDRSVNWGAPKPTTTFPQPFGMSQTWDTKLMEKWGQPLEMRHESSIIERVNMAVYVVGHRWRSQSVIPVLEGQKKDLAKIPIWVVKWHLLI